MFGFGSYGDDSKGDIPESPRTWEDYDATIKAGLPDAERDRMREAYDCLRYANGYFDEQAAARGKPHATARTFVRQDTWSSLNTATGDQGYEKADHVLNLPVMKRVVEKLTENLYRRPPTRELSDKAVSEVFSKTYKKNAMGPKWQRADQFTAIGGFSAFQFAGGDDPDTPVKIHLWSADQVTAWTSPDDPTEVVAVATFDRIDGRTRCVLWTEEYTQEYSTRRGTDLGTVTREFEPVGPRTDNPYRLPDGRGIIPFSFAHFCFPATEFTYDSPGYNFKTLNEYVNFGFDDLGDGVRYLSKPIGLATGVDESWEPAAIIRPGMFMNMAAGQKDAGGNGPDPALSYLAPENAFVQVIWSHLNNWIDLSLEMHGIPPSTIRMILSERSGVSILAEQAPLLGWTEQRRRPFAHYEEQAAIRFCQVAGAHLANNGISGQRYFEAALNPELNLVWPRLYTDLPGPERDRADALRVLLGQASLIDLTQEREDLTRDQAIAKLVAVKADNDELSSLGLNPFPDALRALVGVGLPVAGKPSPNTRITPDAIGTNPMNNPIAGMNADPNATMDSLSMEGG